MAVTAMRRHRAWAWAVGVAIVGGSALLGWAVWRLQTLESLNRRIAQGEVLDPGRATSAAQPPSGVTVASAPAEAGSVGTGRPTGAARLVLPAVAPAAASVSTPALALTPGSASAPTPAWLQDGHPLPWRFAQAAQLAEAGDVDGALSRWRSLYADPVLGLDARYNSANTLLREALRLRAAEQREPAVVMMELAKEAYRSVLRLQPDHWDARYNFDRAQRLQPDAVPADDEAGAPPAQSERAATTMRGISKGLP